MSRPLSVAATPPPRTRSTRADMRISVQVDADSQLCARKIGQRMEVTVSDPFGHTVVTLDLPGAEFMRLVTAMSDAWSVTKK